MVIVIGGALSATLSSYPLGILKDIPKHFAVLIRGNRYNIPKLIEQLVDLGTIARQSGLWRWRIKRRRSRILSLGRVS